MQGYGPKRKLIVSPVQEVVAAKGVVVGHVLWKCSATSQRKLQRHCYMIGVWRAQIAHTSRAFRKYATSYFVSEGLLAHRNGYSEEPPHPTGWRKQLVMNLRNAVLGASGT